MPPKVKKGGSRGGLKDEEIQNRVQIVKQYWPHYQITPALIKNPTRAFVIKLYTDCMQNLDEKLAFATSTQLLPYPPGLCEEELLFLKLSRLPPLAVVDFKLGDLYTFDPVRVSKYILIIMHFLMFTESVMDKTVEICNAVFDAKEQMQKNVEELERLKQEKLEKQIQFTEVKAEKKKLKLEEAAIAPEYESTMALIEECTNKCKDKIEEMDKLKVELEHMQEEVQKLEKTQLNLKNQIVTEDEYTTLKNSLESLETEEKNLEEIDLSNGLFEQKQNMEHLQTCLRELHHLELSEDIFKLSNYRGQMKDEEESLQYSLNLQKNSESEIDALKLQLENEKRVLDAEKKELIGKLKTLTEEAALNVMKLKKTYQQTIRDNETKIIEQQRLLEKREADYMRLQKDLNEKYGSFCEKQDMAIMKYKSFIAKVNKALEDRHVQ